MKPCDIAGKCLYTYHTAFGEYHCVCCLNFVCSTLVGVINPKKCSNICRQHKLICLQKHKKVPQERLGSPYCRWVDEIVTDAPWVITPEFLEKHNIDFVAHDALPYADASGQADDVYGFVRLQSCCIPCMSAISVLVSWSHCRC